MPNFEIARLSSARALLPRSALLPLWSALKPPTARDGRVESTRVVHVNNELQWHPISVMGDKCSLRMWRDDCEENQRSRRKAAQAQEECSGARAGRVTPVSDG